MSTEVTSSASHSKPAAIGGSPQGYSFWIKKEVSHDKGDRDDNDPESKPEDQEGVDRYSMRSTMDTDSPPSSENSNSYEWSFEEQFKQLYELDQEEGRKEFLDDFFEFMKRRGTPVNRIPIMAKQILDLFQLYNLVVKHGGLVQVIRNKLWSKITKGLNLPSSITSAAFTLRTQYLKYLYPYECAMHGFSTPKELQAAIDSNRRDRFSALYHTESAMNSSREECFPSYTVNGCEYPVPLSHSAISAHALGQAESRFTLKRHVDMLPSKQLEVLRQESPKVIVLQDGNTNCPDDYLKKTNSNIRQPTKSPILSSQEAEMRKYEIDAFRSRGHHPIYGGKDWDGDIRHVLQEDGRPCHFTEGQMNIICKDKSCNGTGCRGQFPEHELRRLNGPYITMCPCSYCKEFTKGCNSPQSSRFSNSEVHREPTRHHMEGASALSRERHHSDLGSSHNSSPSSPKKRTTAPEENDTKDLYQGPTMQFKLQEVTKSSDKGILISMDLNGTRYEGMLYPCRTDSGRPETLSRDS